MQVAAVLFALTLCEYCNNWLCACETFGCSDAVCSCEENALYPYQCILLWQSAVDSK